MSVDIKLKHSSQAGKVPTAGDLSAGEVALNTADVKAYMLDDTGSVVTLVGDDSPIDARYVAVDGDNMTGDLTLGTDKITLDASAGSAEFGSYIKTNSFIGSDRTAAGNACFTGELNGAQTYRVNADGTVKLGNTTSAPNITLNADGDITAAGSTTIGEWDYAVTNKKGVELGAYGYISAQRADSDSLSPFFEGYKGDDVTASILSDGSATLAGNLTVGPYDTSSDTDGVFLGSTGGIISQRNSAFSASATVFAGYYGTTNTSAINVDGSGQFAGTVISGSDPNGGAGRGTSFNQFGTLRAANTAGTVFEGYTVGTANSTSSIGADGSAELGGNLTVGPYDTSPYIAGARLFVNNSGGASFVLNGNGSTGTALGVYDGNAPGYSAKILRNGGAEFLGNITSGPKTVNSSTRYTTYGTGFDVGSASDWFLAHYDSSNTVYAGIKNDGSSTFANSAAVAYTFISHKPAATAFCISGGDSNNTGSPKFYITAAGAAVFTGTVTAQGSVLTSDQRFKTNVEPAKPQLEDVVKLGNILKNWDWTEDAPVADKDTRFLGLIAQDLESICPALVTTVERTKPGKELTPEQVIPAVYEDRVVPAVYEEKVVPAVYKTIVIPAERNDEGEIITPRSTEQVLVTPEYTEQVLVTPEYTEKVLVKEEEIIPPTYEELDDSYKAIKNDVFIMKLLGAVAELSAKVQALEAG